ncbi:hypothetical protein ACH5RR_018328 [Cinchona calisaya]|uniref:CCHC-type domain-containing protein n=1 Tax=Cinchona calisaya TaxID=153742 RepID=A0ABD2ZLP2_9GENT
MPTFQGKADTEEYLNWEQKVDFLFDCYDYSNEKKYKLAVSCFSDYAMTWWVSEIKERHRIGDYPITRWTNLKPLLRKRFVPAHYHREQLRKLQSLRQGNLTVEEYAQEMEMAMSKAHLYEDEETTMERFINGLNKEIADVVDLHEYLDYKELLQRANKVEKALRGKSKSNSTSSSNWRFPRTNPEQSKRMEKLKENPIPAKPKAQTSQGNTSAPNRSRDIQCFRCSGRGHISSQCPNKKVLYTHPDGNWTSESEDEMPPLEKPDLSDEDNEYHETGMDGQVLVVLRNLQAQATDDPTKVQRENIFYTKYHVQVEIQGAR